MESESRNLGKDYREESDNAQKQSTEKGDSVDNLADIADKFTRNEILTSNEVRSEIGYRPSDDPGADELRNKNLNRDKNEIVPKQQQPVINKEQEANIQNGE